MFNTDHLPERVSLGEFQLHLRTRELQKNGEIFDLPEQPFLVLMALIERPGQLVTREELIKKLWPADTFVDFEHSLNKAVKRLREALADSADEPRFIETLSRRGYRFIGTLTAVPDLISDLSPIQTRTDRASQPPGPSLPQTSATPPDGLDFRAGPAPDCLGGRTVAIGSAWAKLARAEHEHADPLLGGTAA